MKAYLAKKLIAFPVILIGVSMLIFGSIRALPGDPARLMAGPEATQEAVDNMRVRLGLDQPLVTQYVHFATDVLHGNLGLSLQSQQPVTQEIGERLPFTLALAVLAYFLAVAIGVPAGMIGAVYRNRWPDYGVMLLAIAGASVANFWLGLMAMNYFSVSAVSLQKKGATSWKNYNLPSVTLAVLPMAVMARMTRSSMLDVLSEDYIRTARAKGLSATTVYCS